MKIFLKQIVVVFLIFCFHSVVTAKDTIVFKNKRFGYQLEYPSHWTCQETGELNIDPPELSDRIDLFDRSMDNSPYNNNPKADFGYFLGIEAFGDGTEKKYEKGIYWNSYLFSERKKKEGVSNPTRAEELTLNGNKLEIIIVLKSKEDTYFEAHGLIFCEKSKRLFRLSAFKKFNNETKNIFTDNKIRLTLELLYSPMERQIIESFKCPAPDFIYKKPSDKKSKKK